MVTAIANQVKFLKGLTKKISQVQSIEQGLQMPPIRQNERLLGSLTIIPISNSQMRTQLKTDPVIFNDDPLLQLF